MKEIEVHVGDFIVKVTMTPFPHEHRVAMSADAGSTRIKGVLKLQSEHDHSPEQFAKDVQRFAERLAKEAAGKERGRALIEGHFN